MKTDACGHTATGGNGTYTCDKAGGHKGWHGETFRLRDRNETTNWGDDGLATWASKDQQRRKEDSHA